MGKPNRMKVDLSRGARGEVTDGYHELDLGGETFSVRYVQSWPAERFAAMTAGDLVSPLAQALADETADVPGEPTGQEAEKAYYRFREAWRAEHGHVPTLSDVNWIVDQLADAEGVDGLGNSSGSASGARSTGQR